MYILTFLAVFANGFFYSNPRGGWEVPLMWGLLFFAIALRGGGLVALHHRVFRRRHAARPRVGGERGVGGSKKR